MASTGLDNPDYIHLKSLSDMLRNIELWATAANAQVQILLAKRAPVLVLPPTIAMPLPPKQNQSDGLQVGTTEEDMNQPQPSEETTASSPSPLTKAPLRAMGLSLGIPSEFLDQPKYLNSRFRPSKAGLKATLDLINRVKACIIQGENPSSLWS